jgi:hypothetical protein
VLYPVEALGDHDDGERDREKRQPGNMAEAEVSRATGRPYWRRRCSQGRARSSIARPAPAGGSAGYWPQASTKLREHLASVVTAMLLSDNYEDFIQKLDRVKPRFGDTLPLPLEGPKEKTEPL